MRELVGTLGSRGWRPFMGWGLSAALVGLAFAFVFRFMAGTITGADFVALAAIVLPLCQYVYQRSADWRAQNGHPPLFSGSAMGPGAASGA